MGGGDNEITIKTLLDPSGFVKGSKQLQAAVKSLGNAAKSVGGNAKSAFSGLLSTARRLAPMIIGVGSAFQVISRAVHAFMAENQELSAKMSSIWSSLGNILGPIITQVINWVSTAVSLFIQFLSLLGISVKQSKNAAKAAGGAASELKKTIAGFDELNTLTDNSGGGGGGAGNKELDPAELPDWLKKLANALKNKLWDEAADIIINKFNELIKKFKEKAYEWGKKCGEYFAAAVHMIARFIKEADWKGIGQGIADFIDGLFKDVDPKELGLILVGKFVIAFKILAGFLENLDWKQLAVKISGILVGALEGIGDAIRSADSKKIGENIREFFKNIKWGEIREAFKNLLKTAVQEAIDLLWGVLDLPGDPPNFWKNLSVKKIAKSLTVIVKQAVKDVVSTLWKVVGLPDTPEGFWKNIKEETLQGQFSEKISTAVQGAVDGLWEAINLPGEPPNIIEYISNITENISSLGSGIATFVSEVFEGKFKPVLDYGEKSTLATTIEAVVGAIDSVSSAATTILSGVWNDIIRPFLEPEEGGEKSGLQKLLEGVAEIISTIANTITQNWDNIVAIYDTWLAPMATLTFDTLITMVHELSDFFGNLTSWLAGKKSFAEFWGDLSPVQEKVAAIAGSVGTFAAVFSGGVLVSNIESVMAKLGEEGVTGVVGGLEKKVAILKAGFEAIFSPAGLVMTGLALIISYVNWVDAENKEFVQTLGEEAEAVDGLSGAIGVYANEIKNNLANAASEMMYGLGDGSSAILTAQREFEALQQKVQEVANGLSDGTVSSEEAQESYDALTKAIENARIAEGQLDEYGISHKQLTDMINQLEQERAIILAAQEEALSGAAKALTDEAEAVTDSAKATEGVVKATNDSNAALESVPEKTGEAATGYNDLSTEVDESCGDIVNTTDATASETESTMKDWGSQMVTIVGDTTKEIRDDFESGTTEMGQIASAATQDMNSVFAANFAIIADNAYIWGQDIIINLNNGIMSLVGQFEGNIASLAAMIRSYLGFSEPEKGPLSNFHTFMPDMMKLLSKGIEDNMPLARRAAEDVANTISSSLKAGDYDISAIADNVAFSMPAVAGGGVLPYGIDGSWDGISKGSDDSALIAAVDDLRQLVISFQNTMENMEFVAQFGDVRALAKSITRVQKQMERASG